MIVRVQLDGVERRLSTSELEALAQEGTLGPETPVEVDGAWRPARLLPGWTSWTESPAALARRQWNQPAIPFATALFTGLCIRVMLWGALSLHYSDLVLAFGRDSPAILEGREVWRLVTYAFFHGGFEHILFNLLFLAYVGLAVERVLGSLATGTLLLSTAVGGALVSTWLSAATPSVGASAADFGIIAAAGVIGLRWHEILPDRARGRFGIIMFLYAARVFYVGARSEGVDNWAHLGGFVVGLAVTVAFAPGNARRNRVVSASVLAVTAAGMGAIAAAGWHLEPMTTETDQGTSWRRPAWWTPAWTPTGESGFGTSMGGAVVAMHAETLDRPVSTDDALDTWRDEVLAIDPEAVFDVAGDRATARLHTDAGGDRIDRVRVVARGGYSRALFVDLPASSTWGAWAEQMLVSLDVQPTDADREAMEGASSPVWRLRAKAADAFARTGDLDRAVALYAELERSAEEAPAAAAALDFAATWTPATASARAEAALRAWPGDRGVVVSAARAFAASGQPERAVALVNDALAKAPGDRALTRALRDLLRD